MTNNTNPTAVWDREGLIPVTVKTDAFGDNRFFVDATTQGAASGVFGDDITFHTEDTYTSNETKDLWNYLVPVGKVAFVHSFAGSASKSGSSRSHFHLIRKVGDVTEEDVGGFFADNAHQTLYPKALRFNAGDRIILRITNEGGNNNIMEATLSAVEDNA